MSDAVTPTPTPTPPPTASPWDDVRRLADEVRLKVHLAGMELKEKWKLLEPQLDAAERDIAAAGAKAESVIAKQLDALATGLHKFAADLRAQKAPPKHDDDAAPPKQDAAAD